MPTPAVSSKKRKAPAKSTKTTSASKKICAAPASLNPKGTCFETSAYLGHCFLQHCNYIDLLCSNAR
jgi:hypothetical protein